jgi:hypothetical protein
VDVRVPVTGAIVLDSDPPIAADFGHGVLEAWVSFFSIVSMR